MKQMPKEELFSLTNQIKRAAVSIPSNIAEGQSRGTKEFIHFLRIAQGSLAELQTQLLLTTDLEMIPAAQITPILTELESLSKQINSLIAKLRNNYQQPPTTH
uniref:four helix bundle protein n=1 Tax=Saccharicrinis fermentans TaxID=982 RepID=UPI001F160870|nr:four helix bundle protein [Saccharicrinis fermentans]